MTDRPRLRVLMLTSTLPRWEGDCEPRFVLDLARHLSADFDIELLAPHTQGAARFEVLEGVPVTRFRYWLPRWQSVAYQGGIAWRLRENPARLLQLPFFLTSLAWHVVSRLRRGARIDLVHAHWLIPQGLVAVLVCGLAGRRVPIVTTSHGGDLFGLRGGLWRRFKRKVLQDSDVVTVVSNAMAKAAKEIAGEIDPLVIPMGTDLTDQFIPPIQPRLGSIRNLVFVGRLVEKKGVTYLLQALPLVLRKHPQVRLCVIGHGPLRSQLESEVECLELKGVVSFVGPIAHHRLPEYYQNGDIAVFPFVEAGSGDQEGFGLVMVEAMGCGCAVIASSLPAVADVVQNQKTGRLVSPANVDELASAISAAIANPEETNAMAKAGRDIALALFDWKVCRNNFKKAYLAALEAPDQMKLRH